MRNRAPGLRVLWNSADNRLRPSQELPAVVQPVPAPLSPRSLHQWPGGCRPSVGRWRGGEILIERDVPHTFLDFDQLTYTHPRPGDDQWGERLALRHLEAFWRHCAEAGARNLVISQVCETQEAVDNMCRMIPGPAPTVVQLSASLPGLHERVRRREIVSGLEQHLDRSGELLTILGGPGAPCDVRVETDARNVREIALELADLISWQR